MKTTLSPESYLFTFYKIIDNERVLTRSPYEYTCLFTTYFDLIFVVTSTRNLPVGLAINVNRSSHFRRALARNLSDTITSIFIRQIIFTDFLIHAFFQP